MTFLVQLTYPQKKIGIARGNGVVPVERRVLLALNFALDVCVQDENATEYHQKHYHWHGTIHNIAEPVLKCAVTGTLYLSVAVLF